jgi:hypothetical protein
MFHKMTYPPAENKIEYDLRTADEFREMALLAKENSQVIFGIRGTCPLMDIIKIPDPVPFDYMHLVLQGHTKWLIYHLFHDKKFEC